MSSDVDRPAEGRREVAGRGPMQGSWFALAVLGLASIVVAPALAESNLATGEDAAGGAASVSPEAEQDRNTPPPLAFKALVAKPLTAADLPPPSVFSPRSMPRTASLAVAPERNDRNDRGDGAAFRAIVEREALASGVPPELADAVMAVESGYNPATVGADGEIGLMQLMPATAGMLGFTGTLAELAVPETNIRYGVMYLAAAWQLAGRDICTAAMKYRAGHGETRFSVRSVDYCIRVRAHLAARGFPVTGTVPQPTFGQPFGAGGRGRLPLDRGTGRVDLEALNARLREVTDKVAVRTVR
jgi:soluble lytic murein transglycosylase-like protein